MNFKKYLLSFAVTNILFFGQASMAAEKLVFSSIPEGSRATQDEKYDVLLDHLETTLGKEIEFLPVSDYAALVLAMKGKKVDFAYFGPKSYVDAANLANAKAVALETDEEGNPGYKGIIIVQKDSEFNSIEDLKGKKFAFTDPSSTSGTLVPKVHFSKIGINPDEYFSDVIFSGSHQGSVKTLLLGKVDAVSTNDIDFIRGVEAGLWKNDDVRILWTSELIPGSPFAVRGDLDQGLQDSIKTALTSFDDKEALKRMGIGAIIEADDSTYDSIRDIVKLSK